MQFVPDGGGQLTVFFENDELVKITEWIGPSHGTIITDYYLKNGQLFFAYQRENKFKSIYYESGDWFSLDTSDEENVFEGKYYFDDRVLIKQLVKGERMFNQVFEQTKFLEHSDSIVMLLTKSAQNKESDQ